MRSVCQPADSSIPCEPLIRPFMPELDVLRGVAVLGVLLLHGFSWQYSPRSFGKWGGAMIRLTQPGWVGINLFFVLSGFLITGILLDSKSRPDFIGASMCAGLCGFCQHTMHSFCCFFCCAVLRRHSWD